MGIIYMYTAPNQKSYIGQTECGRKVREGIEGRGYLSCPAFYQAILYFGIENFKYEILLECSDEELNYWELYYIEYYNTLVPNGYNISFRGQNKGNTDPRPKKVYQFSDSGELLCEYPSETAAARAIGCSATSIREVCLGTKNTCLGYLWSYINECPQIKENRRNRTVYQYNEDGELIHEFETAKNAANFYHIPIYQIYQCAGKQRRKRVGNTIFTYDPFIDWNYYSLKHRRSSTTISQESRPKQVEALYPDNISGEDIV